MTKTIFTKVTATTLVILALVSIFCFSSFASEEKTGGADVYIGSEVIHFDNISDAWAKAMSTEKSTKLVLKEDWTADENGNFGNGKYFPGGGIGFTDRHIPFTLDLNGYKVDRELKAEKTDGYVFKINNGSFLLICDTSEAGTSIITGGFNKGNGGAFKVEGSILTVRNVDIKDNKSTDKGGAFWIQKMKFESLTQNSQVTLEGCAVTENSAKTGGAAYVETSNRIRIFDSDIINNSAVADGGIHTEVAGIYRASVTLGGKVVIADNIAEKDGIGLMLDESFFTKVCIDFLTTKPLEEGSRIVILSKTGDKTLRITEDSDNTFIDFFEYENDSYEIIEKGSGDEQYLDIKKA